ncbi:MAG: hypothetical protein H6R19_574 [Proteobacteria bacterium]|nr:hypothetical protein [Pseudomonadota bacterium]
MKTTTTLTRRLTLITLLGAALAMPALAQSGPGMGGPGMRNAAQSTPAANPGMGQGMNQGMGQGMGRSMGHRGNRQGMMGAGQNGTRGYALMTQEERSAHQAQMRQVKTVDECTQLQTQQRVAMEARAKEKGITLPTPRQNACARMQARGLIK